MATFKICVFKNRLRTDGKYRVFIRVTWKRQNAYIASQYYITKRGLDRNYEVTDIPVIHDLSAQIKQYEYLKSNDLRQRIDLFTAKELANFFVKHTKPNDDKGIDFIDFSENYIAKTTNKGTAGLYNTLINSIRNFTQSDELPCTEITSKFLTEYENWLRTKGKDYIKTPGERTVKNLTDSGINLYMRTFKALFNRMRDDYNDEERGEIEIPFNPFKKYKAPRVPYVEKRALTIEQVRAIRELPDFPVNPSSHVDHRRENISRDVFMLSLYFCGMNTVDLYNCTDISKGRISYNRTKTRDRRKDQAYISLKIEPEALPLIKKYADPDKKRVFCFYKIYKDAGTFNKIVNIGLKKIAQALDFDFNLQFYCARHSWATIARNQCRVSKDDVDLALDHIDQETKKADWYIKTDWSVIDKANRKVLNKIVGKTGTGVH